MWCFYESLQHLVQPMALNFTALLYVAFGQSIKK